MQKIIKKIREVDRDVDIELIYTSLMRERTVFNLYRSLIGSQKNENIVNLTAFKNEIVRAAQETKQSRLL